ncbi:hypothetical protein CAEBREN_23899 [Caenorhabditis brenneri]|uniref:Peptidase M12A domain-containing protein n=1 Tax=Caenorhabditis brenneri TaxID=135651 RepID=G0PI02_CAEBE|nr:hypothetical protein CAEBREN_23899 [Caenorhabditis brenneri]
MSKWEQETCARFTRQNDTLESSGLEFINGDGCWSLARQISIGTGCEGLGTVTHEIGHDCREGISYDYGSVMHYVGTAILNNDTFLIMTADPNYQSTIGHRVFQCLEL